MDESDLYRYALLSFIVGLLLLGFVVLFVPISLDDSNINFIDGKVLRVVQGKNGLIVYILDIDEKSLFIDLDADLVIGNLYRFYDPVGDDLLFVDNFRNLSS